MVYIRTTAQFENATQNTRLRRLLTCAFIRLRTSGSQAFWRFEHPSPPDNARRYPQLEEEVKEPDLKYSARGTPDANHGIICGETPKRKRLIMKMASK